VLGSEALRCYVTPWQCSHDVGRMTLHRKAQPARKRKEPISRRWRQAAHAHDALLDGDPDDDGASVR